MSNVHLLIGDELVLKDLKINEILDKIEDYECETFFIDNYKNESYNDIASKINIFLGTCDLFGGNKVLKLVLLKPLQVNPILSKIDAFYGDNTLIIDLRCPEFLIKNMKFEYAGEILKSENFFKFKDYEKDKVYKYIQECFNNNDIKFDSEYDLELSKKYIFENSLNSYSFIYNQMSKLKLLNKKVLNYDDIVFISGGLSDKNSYRICDYMFKFNNIKDISEYLENILYNSNYKMFLTLVNVLAGKLHDYILLNNGKMCKVKANYYIFKNSKIQILNCDELIIKLNKLTLKSKNDMSVPKEEFLLLILEHFYI